MRGIGRAQTLLRRLTRRERPIVLMYHRVAEVACDPWQLAVRPQRFADHLRVLTRERKVVPLAWLVGELRESRIPLGSAVLTFDDGYADVFHTAKPILEEYGCPATVFLTTGALDTPGFWWDVLSRIILETPALPPRLEMDAGGKTNNFDVRQVVQPGRVQGVAAREALHTELWRALRPLDPTERQSVLAELAAWAGVDATPRSSDRVMTSQEAKALSESPLISIGAHTVTHPSLPLIEDEDRSREIRESRMTCERIVGHPITGFAYPFGDQDDASVSAARAAGIQFACTTDAGVVTPKTDLMRIPRILAADWSQDEFRQNVLSFC
ncbi:polysaccharide deacetylase family protein [Microvirga terrae]|uniref:Chitooligosaccharide deacetylase n=1 Tax=Microvirga terrae TaxID=2740529 RepID=A0ABY5RQG3_9HYPH|nr:polysaccharide deacetylase family protein [Microvirga terrae]UVF18432.1 polysaccharide deacetylase family protein [Microvirga terrae]